MKGISFRIITITVIVTALCLPSLVGAEERENRIPFYQTYYSYSSIPDIDKKILKDSLNWIYYHKLAIQKFALKNFMGMDSIIGTPEEAQLYRMPVQQQTPKNGISGCILIAYGHNIRPPYEVIRRDTIVYINGIQMHPPLKFPGNLKYDSLELVQKEHKPWEYAELERLDLEALRVYTAIKKKNGVRKAIEVAADIYRQSHLIRKVEIKGDGLLYVYNIFYDSPGHVPYDYDVGPMPKNLPTKQEIAERVKNTWMKSLDSSGTTIHCNTGSFGSPSSEFFNTLCEIMCDESSDLLDKYSKLRSLDIRVIDCKAIIYNFDAQMWGCQK
ncbi:MAG: hypothetical protein WBB37_06635 [bacterium]